MKLPLFKKPIEDQVTSKGMVAGWGLIGFGVYTFIQTNDINQAMIPIGLGLGILGIRDVQ